MLIAVLDNIRSLYNVGSIFRTADAFGLQKIYLSGYTPAPIGEKQKREIHKTALGAEEFIEWEKSGQTWKLLENLKKQGFYIIGLETDKKAINISKFNSQISKKKMVLVVGNEVKGLSKEVLKRCDKIIKIPMLGKKESLNVSVAFGVAAYCISRWINTKK
jgi:23S rRNA (guanosine2251-2'-O)-methyltransferase